MTTASFSTIAQDVVGQYGQFGKIVVSTYRTGAKRLVTGANTRYVSFLKGQNLPMVDDAVKTRLIDVQTKIADAFVDGIVTGTGRADKAIDFVANGVTGGIDRAVVAVDRVEAALNTTALTSVGQFTLPVAKLSLAIANRTVEGTKRLSARVIGAEAEVVEAVAAVKNAAKRVVKRTAKKAVTQVKASAKTVAKKTRAVRA
ncbi:MAG: hypothetical protein ABI781_15000 [Burkholderiales bacterium]